MAHTTASRYQLDLETYTAGTLGMTVFPSIFESNSQVLVAGTEYFAVLVQQAAINREFDGNINHVDLTVQLRLLYRFVTNEAEYLGSASTPTDSKAALAAIMDKGWWNGAAGLFSPTQSIPTIDDPELSTTRVGRVIETNITVTLVSASV